MEVNPKEELSRVGQEAGGEGRHRQVLYWYICHLLSITLGNISSILQLLGFPWIRANLWQSFEQTCVSDSTSWACSHITSEREPDTTERHRIRPQSVLRVKPGGV